MAEVNAYAKKMGYPELEMGIAIHTGYAFIGNVGSEKMMRYNVIGSIVNECSRIESCTVGGQVFVSEETIANMNGQVCINSRLEVAAKGLQKPIGVCDVTGITGVFEFELQQKIKEYIIEPGYNVIFCMHEIKDKRIEENIIYATVKKLTTKHAIVSIFNDGDVLDTFSDVEITAKNDSGCVLFKDVYAKVTDSNSDGTRLRFTHVGRNFMDYVKDINEHIV